MEHRKELPRMTLDDIHSCLLGILKELDRYCSEHGLKYFLVGGSALGAIRHKGIIPWDDDIDVGLFRDDYEVFCESYEGSSIYTLVSMNRSEGYLLPFAKLYDSRTVQMEPGVKRPTGSVFVDVFPLDYITDSDKRVDRMLFMKRLYWHSFLLDLSFEKFRSESLPKRILRWMMGRPLSGKDPRSLATEITAIATSSRKTQRVMNVWGAWGRREVMEADWFGEGRLVDFGDMKCLVPSEWDKYLTRLYGDYMTPPANAPHNHGHAFWKNTEEIEMQNGF